jgi:hypothetical protein
MCCQSDRYDGREALGLPPGSVRAIFGLLVLGLGIPALIGLMFWFIVLAQYNSALGISSVLSSILTAVIGYYFGNKTATSQVQNLISTHQAALQSKNETISLLSQNLYSNNLNNQPLINPIIS